VCSDYLIFLAEGFSCQKKKQNAKQSRNSSPLFDETEWPTPFHQHPIWSNGGGGGGDGVERHN
jgi:hypothetical protein